MSHRDVYLITYTPYRFVLWLYSVYSYCWHWCRASNKSALTWSWLVAVVILTCMYFYLAVKINPKTRLPSNLRPNHAFANSFKKLDIFLSLAHVGWPLVSDNVVWHDWWHRGIMVKIWESDVWLSEHSTVMCGTLHGKCVHHPSQL